MNIVKFKSKHQKQGKANGSGTERETIMKIARNTVVANVGGEKESITF